MPSFRTQYVVLLCVFVFALLPTAVRAVSSISQGYLSEGQLSSGVLVSLEEGKLDRIVAASTKNVNNLLGVVINDGASLLAVTNGNETQVQVATNGTAQVLVSDINGDIERGDHITASQIAGVGMKATTNVRVVGIAQSDMKNANQQTYKGEDGTDKNVMIGQVPVLVNPAYYFKEPEKTIVPFALQSVANSIAGKSVSTLPIIISGAIFIIMLIVVSSIVYSMIRSSIISVGRNPMSQSAIYRDLIQLSSLVIAILAVGLIAIYLILTRL